MIFEKIKQESKPLISYGNHWVLLSFSLINNLILLA